jgi:hypothetical protein
VKGILADINVVGQIIYLVRMMQSGQWGDFWNDLGLALFRFEDVGLNFDATDVEIWKLCQANELVLITDNRNNDSSDSLAAAIRHFNSSTSLPVFTIARLDRFCTNREYAERVLAALYDYLYRIDELRGTGRLYLP